MYRVSASTVRSAARSLRSSAETWFLTVPSASTMRAAIAWLLRPSATRAATSRSVGVSSASAGGPSPSSREGARARRATRGSMTRPPAATARTASARASMEVSLSRNPAAPAATAPRTTSGSSKVVSTRTGRPGCSRAHRRTSSIPSMTGIFASARTTSTSSARSTARASAPWAAWATTSTPSTVPKSMTRPRRRSCWSSTTRTRSAPLTTPPDRRRRRPPAAGASAPAGRSRRPGPP